MSGEADRERDFREGVHRLLVDALKDRMELDEIEDLGEAVLALHEGYQQDQPPPP